MKVIFRLIVLLFFCLSTLPGFSGSVAQKHKATVTPKADSIRVQKVDSLSNYSININGQSNAVSITKDNSTNKNMDTVGKQKNTSNTIDINGEGNSVTINQNKNAGHVNIQQNGNGNKVNISQSNQNKVK